jgi:GDP-4-dehydro-6-deoxy-D-mannose reductase
VAPDFASQIAAVERGLQAPIIEVGNLAARRDFSDVRDVVRAYVLLITSGEPGQVYNVGAGVSHSIQDVLDTLLSVSPVSIEVRQDAARMRPSDVPDVVCDATRLKEQTGWQTTISFEQSLEDVLDYWRAEVTKQA